MRSTRTRAPWCWWPVTPTVRLPAGSDWARSRSRPGLVAWWRLVVASGCALGLGCRAGPRRLPARGAAGCSASRPTYRPADERFFRPPGLGRRRTTGCAAAEHVRDAHDIDRHPARGAGPPRHRWVRCWRTWLPAGPGSSATTAHPSPGSDLIAACDADPALHGRARPVVGRVVSVLVNHQRPGRVGAHPVGLLDAVGAADESAAAAVLPHHRRRCGVRRSGAGWTHTLGGPAFLAVTATGAQRRPGARWRRAGRSTPGAVDHGPGRRLAPGLRHPAMGLHSRRDPGDLRAMDRGGGRCPPGRGQGRVHGPVWSAPSPCWPRPVG